MSGKIPEYSALPRIEKLDLPHAWDVWGRDDNLGSLNNLTPERRLAAASLISSGEVFNLSLALNEPNPPMYGRSPLKHEIFFPSRNDVDDRLDDFYPQGSSQWDGLRHVRCREYGFWGGVQDTDWDGRLGIEHWAEVGIVGRGVLLDVERYLADRGELLDPLRERSITSDELTAAARHQGVEVRPGDILCVRFGWVGKYLKMDSTTRETVGSLVNTFPGLRPDEPMAETLWNWQIAAIACDNPAIEQSPGDPAIGSLHRRILPLLGMAMGELFVLDDLAARCASEGRWEFFFAAVPLNLPGGVGSPANAIVVW